MNGIEQPLNQHQRYRKNVAAFVLNDKGQILACRRADQYHSWQLPQGGVDQGESLEQAVLRELKEEIGTDDVEIIDVLPQAIRYDWPPHVHRHGFCGQEQHYFLVRLKNSARITLEKDQTAEFDQTAWVGRREFLARLDGFKTSAYTDALQQLMARHPHTFAE